jgi:hypothetical protein
LVRKPEGRKPLRRCREIYDDNNNNNKMDLKGQEGMK